jgi:hypothetical protein
MEDEGFIAIGERIIDARDNVNALFYEKHKRKLLVLGEERDIL